MSRISLRGGLAVIFLLAVAFGGRALGATTANKAEVERLLDSAARAEINGNIPRSISLRQDAHRADPGNRLVRWQLGEVQLNNDWLTVEESQQRAANDRRVEEYQRRRAASGDDIGDQTALAKWCGTHHLLDEARFHWANVLLKDQNNREALRSLNRHWHNGRLLSDAEYHDIVSGASARRRQQMVIRIAKWLDAFAGENKMSSQDALGEIRSIDCMEAIPLIEELIGLPNASKIGALKSVDSQKPDTQQIGDISMAFLTALARMHQQTATESLLRLAVLSPFSQVRDKAVDVLKKRSVYDYAPILLDELLMPIKSSYDIETLSDGTVRYTHSLFREGAIADYSDVYTAEHHLASQPILPNSIAPFMRSQSVGMEAAGNERRVEAENAVVAFRNEQITTVLAKTTGENLGDNPRSWWKYWQTLNDLYVPEERPVYEQRHTTSQTYYSISCFVKGTPVWTKTGRRPIESLEPGDLVLSQNVDTGELKYQPVIGRTFRPPCDILRVSTDNDEVLATRGHPFWIAGLGWRMAKELDDGAVLCGLGKATHVRSIASAGEAAAYNLIVAEFNTYFVGESGVLVHDNSPRKPTRVGVPGIVAK
jgi:hypothetical protein